MEDENKAQVQAQPATLRAVIQVTRKATGKVEEYELTGTAEAVKALVDNIPKED
jgi:hypothetical protein